MLTVEQLRKKIEQTDVDLIKILAARQNLCVQIGKLKLAEGKSIIDLCQEKKNFEFYEVLSKQYHLEPVFIKSIFNVIVSYSRKIQGAK